MRGIAAERRRIIHPEQSAHTAGLLHRAAQVQSPRITADERVVGGVEFRHQRPAVIHELVGHGDQPGVVGPAAHARADAPAQRVVIERQLALGIGRGIGEARDAGELILTVPDVGEVAVIGEVAVRVVKETLRRLRDELFENVRAARDADSERENTLG